MLRRSFNLALLAAILVGGVLAWRSGAERARLAERYRRLASVAGDLPIADPTKVYALALETGEPLHFAWRMHLPANYQATFTHENSGGSGSSRSSSSVPVEIIVRVRFRRDEAGRYQVFARAARGSSLVTIDEPAAKLLAGHEGNLRIERLASEGPVEIDPKGSARLLSVALPDSLAAEARASWSPDIFERCFPNIFTFTLGPKPPQP